MKTAFKKWGASPESDWQTMFSIFLVLLVVVIIFASFLFSQTSANPVPAEDTNAATLSQSAIHRTALYYDDKQALYDRTKAVPDVTPDPSK